MDPSDVIQLLAIIILVILSAFFSSAETALVTVNRIRMRGLAEEGDKRAATVLRLVKDQGKLLSAILIGNNIVNLSASSLATILVTRVLGRMGLESIGPGVATGVLTLIILLFGEVSPKTMATVHSEKMSLIYAKPMYYYMQLMTPLIFIINTLSSGFIRLLGTDPNQRNNSITEEELKVMVDVSEEEGIIENDERKMIRNVVDFGDAQAKDIMIPRIDTTFINADSSYQEVIHIFRQDRYTRMPVYEDNTDNIIGHINMKDLLLYDPAKPFHVKDFLRDAYFTYEYKKVSELFHDMKGSAVNMAIVLDEYGSTSGIITLEDLLEEIVGEIQDEYDEEEKDSVQKISETEYLVEGSMKLNDLNDLLELTPELSSEDYDSIGGYVIGLLDRLPKVGETVEENGYTFIVETVDKNRIEQIRMILPPDETENNDEKDGER